MATSQAQPTQPVEPPPQVMVPPIQGIKDNVEMGPDWLDAGRSASSVLIYSSLFMIFSVTYIIVKGLH